MPKECVVGGCKNMPKDGVSFHEFPDDALIRDQWVKAVKSTRKFWNGPSAHSVVCSNHFVEEDFLLTCRTKKKLGIKTKMYLEKSAIPTVFCATNPKFDRRCLQKGLSDTCEKKSPGIREQERAAKGMIFSTYSMARDMICFLLLFFFSAFLTSLSYCIQQPGHNAWASFIH